jgi:hypothetical protein
MASGLRYLERFEREIASPVQLTETRAGTTCKQGPPGRARASSVSPPETQLSRGSRLASTLAKRRRV